MEPKRNCIGGSRQPHDQNCLENGHVSTNSLLGAQSTCRPAFLKSSDPPLLGNEEIPLSNTEACTRPLVPLPPPKAPWNSGKERERARERERERERERAGKRGREGGRNNLLFGQ